MSLYNDTLCSLHVINRSRKKVISPYIMLYFVVCMLQIGRDKKKSNKSPYNAMLCSLYVSNRSR